MRASSIIRVILLSDTHGVLDERIAALAKECDVAVHAGDIGNAGVLDALASGGAEVFAVRGNNDVAAKWPRGARNALAALEDVVRVDLPGGILIATHGDRLAPRTRHARLRASFADARAIVYGHSHRLVVDDGSMPWVLNPGAAGRARTYGGPSCLVLEASKRGWRIEPRRFAPVSAR